MPISQTFLYLQEDKKHFVKVRPLFIKDAKNHRNRLNLSCRKTRFKNITNTHINRVGPPLATTTATATKTSLKKWICAPSNFIALIPTRSFRQMLANLSGVEFYKTVSKFRKNKKKKVVVLCSRPSTKREIRQFHVVVVQRRQRNVQKSVMHVQSCCFACLNLSLFCRSR